MAGRRRSYSGLSTALGGLSEGLRFDLQRRLSMEDEARLMKSRILQAIVEKSGAVEPAIGESGDLSVYGVPFKRVTPETRAARLRQTIQAISGGGGAGGPGDFQTGYTVDPQTGEFKVSLTPTSASEKFSQQKLDIINKYYGGGGATATPTAPAPSIGQVPGVPPTTTAQPDEPTRLSRLAEQGRSMGLDIGPKPLTPDKAGIATLAEQAIGDIQRMRSRLFPTGEARSFRRFVAGASNLPGRGLPVIPTAVGEPFPFADYGQQIARQMYNALASRILIQTGVAARPDEVEAAREAYAPGLFSGSQNALDALDSLAAFNRSFLLKLQTGKIDWVPGKGIVPVGAGQTDVTLGSIDDELRRRGVR